MSTNGDNETVETLEHSDQAYNGPKVKKFKGGIDDTQGPEANITDFSTYDQQGLSDCGECNVSHAMPKFGDHGQTKKVCIRRLCPDIAVQEDEEPEPENNNNGRIKDELPVIQTESQRSLEWIGEPIQVDAARVYYNTVNIDGDEFKIGDYVMVETSETKISHGISKIIYMWKDVEHPNSGFFHAELFIRSSDTILGKVGDPREVFLGDRCRHGILLMKILRKVSVERKYTPDNWFNLGGEDVEHDIPEDDGMTYYYSKFYKRSTSRFEDVPPDPICPNELQNHTFCPSCERRLKRYDKCIPKVINEIAEKSEFAKEDDCSEWTAVLWNDYEYKKGCGVFLKTGLFHLENKLILNSPCSKIEPYKVEHENTYPEYYRKKFQNLSDFKQPFCVGHIVAVIAKRVTTPIPPQHIYLIVNVLYRPENTNRRYPHHEDLNLVYWSEEIREVRFIDVVGPCHLAYKDNIPSNDTIYTWLKEDASRMYFSYLYDKSSGKFKAVPPHARNIGPIIKKYRRMSGKRIVLIRAGEVKRGPLRTLDLFAGCGGLSEGLRQVGIAECKWAIENDGAAAKAYSLNHEKCIVFNEDCSALLKDVKSGATHSSSGLRLPRKNEVELLCGGPPCQEFSGMNIFGSREFESFYYSPVASCLSYCDYYRPKYFILETEETFVMFEKGMVLQLTIRALLAMGYQCTFGILQAGHYGVPQDKRILVILAAAPGFKLPLYPEPTHVFNGPCNLTTMIDGKRFISNIKYGVSAPKRTCTIQDAISDLPKIYNGAYRTKIEHEYFPESDFQRMVRSTDNNAKLRDHICKKMTPLVEARMCMIPMTCDSDWRDLPNVSVTLPDGTDCEILQYHYEDKTNGNTRKRGVCACAAGGICNPADEQDNTLIPWCLSHTANWNNNWEGLYGRVSWDGYFTETVTDPEPMGKQGRVVHPEQTRVVSVRECARSQGFPDTYLFAGTMQDKYRQVGNAVPPPLAAALGREIKKVLL